MKIVALASVTLMLSLSGMAQGLRTAGTLLVDVSADALTAGDGEAIAQWPNAGTLGGSFAALTNNAGVCFTNNILGRKAVLFTGSAQNALTNVAAPAALTGNSAWSMEAWVWVAAVPAAKSVYLAWTEDTSANLFESTRLMFRYDTGSTAVDNLGTTIGYGYGTPAAAAWHHVAVVRNAFKQEKVFVDGSAVAFGPCEGFVQTGFPLTIGAVKKFNTAQYTNFFSGALSRVRLHAGMLSDQDVLHNYLEEALNYNAAASAVWTGGSGNWNDSEKWSNGVVGASSKAVRILSGTVAVTNNVSPSILRSLDITGASVSFADANARIETKAPLVVGRSSGNAGSVDVARGTLVVNAAVGPAILNLGLDGASSAFTVGGSSSSASAYASQVRTFPGTGSASVQLNSNGVLELDAFVAEALTNAPAITFSGGALRSKTGPASLGQFFNVTQAKVSAGGAVFDSVAGSTQVVSTALIHDDAGASKDGGLRKTSTGMLVLSGTNSYNGETSVEAGTLSLATRLTDGLVYRLDASSNALSTLQFADASNVVSWADANGSGILFSTNTADKCPVYDASLFGGRGGLRFNRDEDISRRLTANRATRAQSVFFVINPANNNSLGGLWGKAGDDYGIRLTTSTVQFCGNGNDFASSGWTYTNGAAGNAFSVSRPLVVTCISGSAQTWTTAIGSYSQYRRHFRGDLAEMLVYDRRLDDRERQEVETYLMAKWLGTVPPPSFSASRLPTNTVLSIRGNASVELNGTPANLSSLSGAGSIGNRSTTPSALTLGGLNAESVYAGVIAGNVAVTKTGDGRVTLSGPNTFTGPLAIEAGTLRLVTGSSSITGLVYRLDASRTNTLTTLPDGSNVTVWADAEGSGYTFSTTNDLNCPVYDRTLFNGRGGLRFGLGARKRMLGQAETNAQTVFAVNMIRDTGNDNGGLWGQDAADTGLRIGGTTWYFPGNFNDFHYGGAGGLVCVNGIASNSNVTVGQPHLVTSVSGSLRSFKPAIGDYWGSFQYPTRYYRGEVAEIQVYNRQLSDLERQTVEAALMAKWFPATGSGTVLQQTAVVSVAAGATLDLGAGSVTITSLAGGGTVSNGSLTVTGAVAPAGTLSLPGEPNLTGSLALDISDAGTGDSLSVAGALDVTGLALTLNLPASRPSVHTFTLVSAPGGLTGTFKSASVPSPWRLVYTPTSIRLIFVSGTQIMIH